MATEEREEGRRGSVSRIEGVRGGMEARIPAQIDSIPPAPESGASITRQVSIRKEEDVAMLARRDSLEGTRSFQYGVSPASTPTTTTSRLAHRHPPRPESTATRPFSPDSVPGSPPRLSAPIQTPRAFLSPKKPAAAIRLEQQRAGAHRPHSTTTADTGPSRATYRSSEHGFSPEPLSLDAMLASPPVAASQRFQTGASLRHSIPDVSTPPMVPIELSSDSLVYPRPSEKETAKTNGTSKASVRVRRYTTLENKQTTWLCGGRLMTGGDHVFSIIFTLTILLGLTGVWIGTTGVWLWKHGTEYGLAKGGGVAVVIVLVYLFGLTLSSFCAAALRDPGIIPRNLDPDPPRTIVDDWWDADNREMTIRDGKVAVKYCETCRTYRPPRASHCRLCGNCVDGIDHHCSFIHTCVGKRNYLAFLTLLVVATFSTIYIVVFSALHFSLLCHHDNVSFATAIKESPGAAVSFLLGVFVLPAILLLLYYHVRLLLYNLTTVQQLHVPGKSNTFWTHTRPENPFAEDSWLSNILLASLARPQFPSWVDASGYETVDTREPNPALTDPRWAKEMV